MNMDETELKNLRKIAEKVEQKQCILFIGAGIHCPPQPDDPCDYPESNRPLSGKVLSKRLADKCDFQKRFPSEGTDNLARVSQYYEMVNDRNQLVAEISEAVSSDKTPSPLLNALAELQFPMIVTTNYDQLFETALRTNRTNKSNPFISVYSKHEHAVTANYPGPIPTGDRPFLFKIHGDIDRPESIVITDDDYIQFVMRMGDKQSFNPIPSTFSYLFTQWTTLFIGYSLMDYNLRLLFQTLRSNIDKSLIPPVFSLDYSPDPIVVHLFETTRRYVRFIVTDAWKFVPALYCMVTKKEKMPCE